MRPINADEIEWYACFEAASCPRKNVECKDCENAVGSRKQIEALLEIEDLQWHEIKNYNNDMTIEANR